MIHILIAIPQTERWSTLPEATVKKLQGEKVLHLDVVQGTKVYTGKKLIQILTEHRPAAFQNFLSDPVNGITHWIIVWAHDVHKTQIGTEIVSVPVTVDQNCVGTGTYEKIPVDWDAQGNEVAWIDGSEIMDCTPVYEFQDQEVPVYEWKEHVPANPQLLNFFADVEEFDASGNVISTRRPTGKESKQRLHRWDIPELREFLG